MRSSLSRMRSSLVVRASDCQCTSCNGPGFDPSIRRHSGICGAADEAVLNIVWKKIYKKSPQKKRKKKEPANCGLATVVMWICGSYCEWNKHHEEEAWPHFCCSILFPRSMHQPGYIQEGQEAIFGRLLLGVYYRNSPSATTVHIKVVKKSSQLLSLSVLQKNIYNARAFRQTFFYICWKLCCIHQLFWVF